MNVSLNFAQKVIAVASIVTICPAAIAQADTETSFEMELETDFEGELGTDTGEVFEEQTEEKKCNPKTELPCEGPERDALALKMAKGFVKAIGKESKTWYECGVETPKEQWLGRALKMAHLLLDALDEYDVNVTPWGPWGVMFSESRGNRCAIGPHPRKYAHARGIIKKENWRLWSEKDVLMVMGHRRFKRRPADLGLGQVVWKDFARLKEGDVVRIPTVREMISLETGTRIFAYEMGRRTNWKKTNRRYRKMPWLFWPGTSPHLWYARRIAMVVKRMGGPYRRVLGHS